MSFQTPTSTVSTQINGLGRLDGFQYADGVEQFCGIPYATLSKRWTRSLLNTSWENGYHDGTQLGNNCPRPLAPGIPDSSPLNPFIPVPPNPNFPRQPTTDEKTALVINVVIPEPLGPTADTKKFPVLAFVHGGSLLYGSSSYGIYDGVNLVSHSLAIGLPIVMVSFNYRLGLGGFLASSKIADELKADGFSGNGNFGFTDQKVAMEWVQKYIAQFGGDPDNVTVVGQSAGAVSIGHHLAANEPMRFKRAVCMSGLGSTLRALSLEKHEFLFNATCRYFLIDAQATDALDRLRKIPEQILADADHVIQGAPSGTGNPCLDGWFYAHDPLIITETPSWLKTFMIGDMHDEEVIFFTNLLKDTYATVRETILRHVQDEEFVNTALEEYGITPDLSGYDLIVKVCVLGAEAVFQISNYKTALVNTRLQIKEHALFKYHFDQRSHLKNILEGTAYHGFDILFLFMNLFNKFNDQERTMARRFASSWIRFVHGQEPWGNGTEPTSWKVWGPDYQEKIETEAEDEPVRHYSRFKKLLALGSSGIWDKYIMGVDDLLMKRGNAGKFDTCSDSGR
ncbi:uncharacterized protein N7459_003405 [Penicillium hispanicum]|uniref:uncharacterized protein n=1 Tax=Penicillium hispanicum TaxID=1080232 RepID=UPI0025414009|nr:uncharacterized protein N7459_003405 [Penicillium hispanicum]KAJ5587640.1 hypothetical protein N7459_003405 [Penicillium hispanicum]